MASRYSRLPPDRGREDIALSQLSSSTSMNKMPAWQDTIQSLPPPPKKRGFFGAIKGWWVELCSIVLAFAIMLCTIILLAFYNGKSLSETPHNPSLNTLINIFSAFVAGITAFVAAEVISQAKWLSMGSQMTLEDFNVMDNASRGLRGAAQVLFKPRLGPMSFIGAAATLLAVLIGPMLQETFVLRTSWLPDSTLNASVPVSRFFAPPSNPLLSKLDVGMKGTIINGLSSTNNSILVPTFGCSTGNCTYDTPYTSFGICHSCQKLQVSKQCSAQNCNYTLPNGHALINTPSKFVGDFQFMNVSTAFNTSGQMAIPANEVTDQLGIVRASIISLTNGPICTTNGSNPDCTLPNRDNATLGKLFDDGAIGAFCDLVICANTYTADITESRTTEKVIASTDARNTTLLQYFFLGSDGSHFDPVILPDQCYIDGKPYALDEYKNSNNKSWTYADLQPTFGNGNDSIAATTVKVPIDCVFAMPDVTYQSLIQFMTGNPFFLDGQGTSDSNTGVAGGVFSFYPNIAGESPGFLNQVVGIEPLFNNGNASFDTIDASFERLATAMTTYMRQLPAQKNSDYSGLEAKLAALAPTALGVLLRPDTIVVVQWYWIILPVVVLLTICAYLIAAIIRGGIRDRAGNSQAHLWKSSALVPLLIGRNSQLGESTSALDGPQAMRALKKKKMTLVNSKDGWALVDTERAGFG